MSAPAPCACGHPNEDHADFRDWCISCDCQKYLPAPAPPERCASLAACIGFFHDKECPAAPKPPPTSVHDSGSVHASVNTADSVNKPRHALECDWLTGYACICGLEQLRADLAREKAAHAKDCETLTRQKWEERDIYNRVVAERDALAERVKVLEDTRTRAATDLEKRVVTAELDLAREKERAANMEADLTQAWRESEARIAKLETALRTLAEECGCGDPDSCGPCYAAAALKGEK